MTVSMELVRELATLRPGAHVLSVYAHTDPRNPANTGDTPAWLVDLRNQLRDATQGESRDRRVALRRLSERVELEMSVLDPNERGRGLAWFLTPDGELDRRFSLQLSPRSTLVRWDERPYVSPLVDVVDRGRSTGLILVGAEAVRLLHWEVGQVAEPAHSLYEPEQRDWRDYDAYVGRAGGSAAAVHVATFDQRLEEWRQQFLTEAAAATSQQVTGLDWQRIVVAGDRRIADIFIEALPASVRDRVIATLDANLLWEELGATAERLENVLDEAWRREARQLVDRAVETAKAGGTAALGWTEVLDCLIQHRVEHLVFAADARPDPDLLAPPIQEALDWPSPDMVVERAVEHAVGSGASITAAEDDVPQLRQAGGVVAILRY